MKKETFWILLLIEFLCCWVATDIFVGKGWLNALLLVGGNIGLLYTSPSPRDRQK